MIGEASAFEDVRGAFVGEHGAGAAKAKVEFPEVLGSRHLRLDARDSGAGIHERGETRVRHGVRRGC